MGLKGWLTGPKSKEARAKTEQSPVIALDAKRIAVLPLRNMSPDPNDEYFADGMTEELITALSSIAELTVIARTSVMQYRNSPKTIADVGRELRTGTVIEGSVRKTGNKVRITVQMVDARTEGHLWAQNYDRQMDDIFAIQSEIAEKVADALKVKLVGSEKRLLDRRRTRSTEAYSLYLKGRNRWNDRSRESLLDAIKQFEKAVQLDSEFALAYSGLADCYDVMIGSSFMTLDEGFPKQKRYALKAVQLDDLSAEAHASLAAVLMDEYDWVTAEKELKRAMQLNPSYSVARSIYGVFLSVFRRFDEALNEAITAEQLDPRAPNLPLRCARLYWDLGQLDRAEQKVKRALELQPDFGRAYFEMFLIHRSQQKWEECARDLDKLESFEYEPKLVKALRGVVSVGLGRLDEAKRILNEISESFAYEQQFENASHLDLLLALDEHEKAVRLVEATYRRTHFMGVIASEPVFESLRRDPRVQEVLKKVGLVP